ncbi:serine hydrolase domain-containing protein [Roseivirga sp. BDSF3-8]|uniref:serine hydrolase domain-containing protein n=1 Tax=Roseivirga sp. BDSF3-8 TaxID=3241598 RepID=UPI003532002F
MSKTHFFTLALLLCTTAASAQIHVKDSYYLQHPQLSSLDSTIAAGTYGEITSVLVARQGKLIVERYYNGADENSRHNTRSATKTIASLLTGVAVDRGYFDSEKDLLFTHLAYKLPVDNPDPRKDSITLEDLLTMSSPLECDDSNPYSRGNEERMYPIEDWTGFFLDLPIRSYPFGPKPEELPYGRSFSYCTAGAATLAEAISSAAGMSAQELAKEALFRPLGITEYTLHHTPQDILNTAGGSEYRSRDLLKLIQMCLNGGRWNGQQVIPQEWIEKATTPKVQVRPGLEYGYLFWLKGFGENEQYKAYSMAGNGGQKVLAIPELDMTVVITTTNYGNRQAHDYTDAIINDYILPAIEQ